MVLRILLIISFICAATSCSTKKQIHDTYRGELAKECVKEFPINITSIEVGGVVSIKTDTVKTPGKIIDCEEVVKNNPTDSKVQCPESITISDTIEIKGDNVYYERTDKLKVLADEVDHLKKENERLLELKKYKTYFFVLVGLLSLLMLFKFLPKKIL